MPPVAGPESAVCGEGADSILRLSPTSTRRSRSWPVRSALRGT